MAEALIISCSPANLDFPYTLIGFVASVVLYGLSDVPSKALSVLAYKMGVLCFFAISYSAPSRAKFCANCGTKI